jgi:type VI secretion system protein ImpF
LFERLIDEEPNQPIEQQPLRVLGKEQLAESVRRELLILLNTRSSSLEQPEHGWTVLEYGLQDFSGLYTYGSRDDIARIITRAIEQYEPRLQNPRVTVETRDGLEHSLAVRIEGSLVMGTVTEPVSFPLMSESGQWTERNGG